MPTKPAWREPQSCTASKDSAPPARIHTTRILSLSEDLPVVIIIVDSHDRIRDFLPQLEELVTEGLVIMDDCEVIRYVGTHPDGVGGGHAPLDTPGHHR